MSETIEFPVDELAPGQCRRVEVGRRGILLVRADDGRYWAIADVCPHQGARLSGGHLGGDYRRGEDGDIVVERPGEVVRCPWHNFAYDVTTGCSLFEPERYRVRTYPVTVTDEVVSIEV